MANRPSVKLQKEWAKKLKKSGFKDIEQDEFYLKRWSADFGRNRNLEDKDTSVKPTKQEEQILFKSKQDYYYYATHFLNEYEFKSMRDKTVWMYHSEGITYEKIVTLLKKVKINISLGTVHNIVIRLAEVMKEKYFK